MEHVDLLLEVLDIHASGISTQRKSFIGMCDLLGAEGKHNIVHPCSDGGIPQVQGRRGSGARILAVNNGDTIHPDIPEHYFAPNGMLVGEHAPERVGYIGCLYRILRQPRILQDKFQCFLGHALDRSVEVLAESNHSNTNDIYFFHTLAPYFSLSMLS